MGLEGGAAGAGGKFLHSHPLTRCSVVIATIVTAGEGRRKRRVEAVLVGYVEVVCRVDEVEKLALTLQLRQAL